MPSKMYILVREKMIEEHLGHATVSVAHAGAAAILNWWAYPKCIDNPDGTMGDWISNSFRKVVCKVSEKEFERAINEFNDYPKIILRESSLGDERMCVVFHPREEWPNFFKYLKLWR